MKTLLILHTSLNGASSLSSSLARRYADRWQDDHPAGRIVERDLAARPVPHLTAGRFAAFGKAPDARSTEEAAWVAEFATRGGRYEGTALDTRTGFVRTFFGFLGIDDVAFVYAEGTALGEASLNAAIDTATAELDRVLAEAA